MQYCTPAQIIERFDSRTIGQLLADDGTEIEPVDLIGNVVLQNHLQSASGRIEAALIMGNRYLISDLQAIARIDPFVTPEDPLANNSAWLIQLCAEITFSTLWRRRPWDEGDVGDTIGKAAEEELERLRSGQLVFNLPAIAESANGWVGGASSAQLRSLNLIVDQCRPYYYPMRRTPNNR